MKCTGCGAQLAPYEKKCPYCGTWREEPKVEKVVKIIEKPQEPICHNPNNSPVQNRKPFIEQSKELDLYVNNDTTTINLLDYVSTNIEGPFSYTYDGKEFDTKRDVFNWVILHDIIVFLLKENNKEFNDNLVALDRKGNVLWSSKEIIEASNRLGACFVGLGESLNKGCIVNVQAYVGINYAIEVQRGRVISKTINK